MRSVVCVFCCVMLSTEKIHHDVCAPSQERAGGGAGHGPHRARRSPSYTEHIASRSLTQLRLASPARTHERNETISRLDSPPNLRDIHIYRT